MSVGSHTLQWQWQVLLRKGGIREPTFRPAARRFLLLPTSFHSAAGSLKPGATARYAEVRGAQHFTQWCRLLSACTSSRLCASYALAQLATWRTNTETYASLSGAIIASDRACAFMRTKVSMMLVMAHGAQLSSRHGQPTQTRAV